MEISLDISSNITEMMTQDPINCSPNVTDAPTIYILKKTLYVLYMFLLPTVLVLGFCGNTLSFLVFTLTPVKNLSSSVYLAALALSDNGFILTYIISWLPFVNIRIFHEVGWCQVVLYLTYVFSSLSVWYVCGFTLERFLVVFYPLRRHVLCTNRRAKITVSSLAMCAIVTYTFPLWTSESIQVGGETNCQIKPAYHTLMTTVGYIDTAITLVIPFIIIIILNSRICFVLLHNTEMNGRQSSPHRWQDSLYNSTSCTIGLVHRSNISHHSNGHHANGHSYQHNRQQDSQWKVTKMLITVSTAFIVLNLPSHAIRFYIYCMHISNKAHLISVTIVLYQHVFQTLFYMNYAINFVMYSLVGNNFRVNLKKLVLCVVHRDRSYLARQPAEIRVFSRPVVSQSHLNTPPHDMVTLTEQTTQNAACLETYSVSKGTSRGVKCERKLGSTVNWLKGRDGRRELAM